MKKRMFGCILSVALLLSSCTVVQDSNKPADSEKEQQPLVYLPSEHLPSVLDETRYNSALDEVKNGVTPTDTAPTNPAETGFAILPLDKDLYGTNAYVFLPSDREITDQEVLQIAFANGQTSFAELKNNSYVIGADISYANRALTFQERLFEKSAIGLYFGKQQKPSSPLSNDPKDGKTILIVINERKFWIYPPTELTEQDMLQVTDASYGNLDEETLKKAAPQEGEIQYDEAKEIALKLLNDFVSADLKPEGAYMMYMLREFPERYVYWDVDFTFSDGYDISILFSPSDGTLINWQSYVHGVLPYTHDNKEAKNWTDDEVLEAAQEYIDKITPLVSTISEIKITTEPISSFANTPSAYEIKLIVTDSGGEKSLASLGIRKSDLTVLGLFLDNVRPG